MEHNLFMEDLHVGKMFSSEKYKLEKEQIIKFAFSYAPNHFILTLTKLKNCSLKAIQQVAGKRRQLPCAL